MAKYGGYLGSRRISRVFNPAFRPGASEVEISRQINRDFTRKPDNMGRNAGGGSSSGGGSEGSGTIVNGVRSLRFEDGGTNRYDNIVLDDSGTVTIVDTTAGGSGDRQFTFGGVSVISTVALPGSPSSLYIYWRTSDNTLWWHDGTSWFQLGVGDVTGPASATDNAIARWHTTSGTDIQNSVVLIEDDGDITGAQSLGLSDEAAAPYAPGAGLGVLWVRDSDGHVIFTHADTATSFDLSQDNDTSPMDVFQTVTGSGTMTQTADRNETVLINASANLALTIGAGTTGKRITFKRIDGNAALYTVTITPSAGVDAQANFTLTKQFQSVDIRYSGSLWYFV